MAFSTLASVALATGAKIGAKKLLGGKKKGTKALTAPINIPTPTVGKIDPVTPDLLSSIDAPGFTARLTGEGPRVEERQVKRTQPAGITPFTGIPPGGIRTPFGALPQLSQLFQPRTATETIREFVPGDRKLAFERAPAVGRLAELRRTETNTAISEIQNLEKEVEPGFGRLTASTKETYGRARADLAQQRRASLSDLRGGLARRRVLGSSFGRDVQTRSALEFEDKLRNLDAQEQQALATSALQELDAKTQLINRKAELRTAQITDSLTQFNFESELAAKMTSQFSDILSQSSRLEAELAAKAAFLQATLGAEAGRTAATLQAGGAQVAAGIEEREAVGTSRFIGGVVDDIFDEIFKEKEPGEEI